MASYTRLGNSSDFTAEQEKEFGCILADNFGGHFQTGRTPAGLPYVAVKMGPNLPVRFYVVDRDGTMVDGGLDGHWGFDNA